MFVCPQIRSTIWPLALKSQPSISPFPDQSVRVPGGLRPANGSEVGVADGLGVAVGVGVCVVFTVGEGVGVGVGSGSTPQDSCVNPYPTSRVSVAGCPSTVLHDSKLFTYRRSGVALSGRECESNEFP